MQEQTEPSGHVTRCGKIGMDYDENFPTKNIVHHKKKNTRQMSPLSILHMYYMFGSSATVCLPRLFIIGPTFNFQTPSLIAGVGFFFFGS
jgi:hypothetical protein